MSEETAAENSPPTEDSPDRLPVELTELSEEKQAQLRSWKRSFYAYGFLSGISFASHGFAFATIHNYLYTMSLLRTLDAPNPNISIFSLLKLRIYEHVGLAVWGLEQKYVKPSFASRSSIWNYLLTTVVKCTLEYPVELFMNRRILSRFLPSLSSSSENSANNQSNNVVALDTVDTDSGWDVRGLVTGFLSRVFSRVLYDVVSAGVTEAGNKLLESAFGIEPPPSHTRNTLESALAMFGMEKDSKGRVVSSSVRRRRNRRRRRRRRRRMRMRLRIGPSSPSNDEPAETGAEAAEDSAAAEEPTKKPKKKKRSSRNRGIDAPVNFSTVLAHHAVAFASHLAGTLVSHRYRAKAIYAQTRSVLPKEMTGRRFGSGVRVELIRACGHALSGAFLQFEVFLVSKSINSLVECLSLAPPFWLKRSRLRLASLDSASATATDTDASLSGDDWLTETDVDGESPCENRVPVDSNSEIPNGENVSESAGSGIEPNVEPAVAGVESDASCDRNIESSEAPVVEAETPL